MRLLTSRHFLVVSEIYVPAFETSTNKRAIRSVWLQSKIKLSIVIFMSLSALDLGTIPYESFARSCAFIHVSCANAWQRDGPPVRPQRCACGSYCICQPHSLDTILKVSVAVYGANGAALSLSLAVLSNGAILMACACVRRRMHAHSVAHLVTWNVSRPGCLARL